MSKVGARDSIVKNLLSVSHATAESFRTGFFGPYALVITNGPAPSANLDFSFFDNLGLQGYVPASGRGTVRGTYSGTLSGLPVTIGFKVRLHIPFDRIEAVCQTRFQELGGAILGNRVWVNNTRASAVNVF